MKKFSKAIGRNYILNGEIITFLGLQDIPGWAFVGAGETFFGIRTKELSKLQRA